MLFFGRDEGFSLSTISCTLGCLLKTAVLFFVIWVTEVLRASSIADTSSHSYNSDLSQGWEDEILIGKTVLSGW
jgi:hypothetical protein